MLLINPTLNGAAPKYVSAPNASPVARYTILGLVGSVVISVTPRVPNLSVVVIHVLPPFVDFQAPPPAAAAHMI